MPSNKRHFARKKIKEKYKPQPKRALNVTEKNLAPLVKDIMNKRSEQKYFETFELALSTTTENPIAISLSNIPTGNNVSGRAGNTINGVSLECSQTVYRDQTPGTTQAFTRWIIFRWRDDTLPVIGDILQLLQNTENNVGSLYTSQDLDNKYSILSDRTYTVNEQVQQHHKRFTIKLRNQKIKFNGNLALDVQYNQIYMFVFSGSNVTGPAGDLPRITYHMRLNYTDS